MLRFYYFQITNPFTFQIFPNGSSICVSASKLSKLILLLISNFTTLYRVFLSSYLLIFLSSQTDTYIARWNGELLAFYLRIW